MIHHFGTAVSALGHLQIFVGSNRMSASLIGHGRKSAASFDQLVGARKRGLRNIED